MEWHHIQLSHYARSHCCVSCCVSLISSLNACLHSRRVCTLILKPDHWPSLALMNSRENKHKQAAGVYSRVLNALYNSWGWIWWGKISSFFCSLPLSPPLSSSLFYFLYSLPCGLWGLNANVLVFHLLLDPTGFIESNQICWLPLLITDTEKRTEIHLSCMHPYNFSKHISVFCGTAWALLYKHYGANISTHCNVTV